MTIPEHVDGTHFTILTHWRIVIKKLADTLEISLERVLYIIHEIFRHKEALNQMLTRMCDQVIVSQAVLIQFRQDCLVITGETWIHIYDPEINEQSKEWRHSCSSHPETFKSHKSSKKLLAQK